MITTTASNKFVTDELLREIDAFVEKYREDYIRDLQALINVESVASSTVLDGEFPFGEGVAKAIDEAIRIAGQYGFTTENDDYYCASAILNGDTKEEISFVGHLDVVPAGDGWDFPPFESKVIDGQITGRGSSDDKGPLMAVLYAMRIVKDLGIPLKHTIRLLMGGQEECGMQDIPHFLEKHERHLPKLFLVCDCPFPIHHGEKGIIELTLSKALSGNHLVTLEGGVAGNSVPAHAWAVVDGKRIEAEGVAGHAAFPKGSVNAIGVLARQLLNKESEPVEGLILDEQEKAVLEFVAGITNEYDGSFFGIQDTDADWGPLTCVGGTITTKNHEVSLSLNIRYRMGIDGTTVISKIEKKAAEYGFKVCVQRDSKPYYLSPDSMGGLPQKLSDFTAELLGDSTLRPELLAGGTHARCLPNAIGFGPDMESDPPCIGHAHAHNETVRLDIMERAIKIYSAAIIELDHMMEG